MDITPLILSRFQFGGTIAFHIIFPAFTVGLAAWLCVLEATWLATDKPVYRRRLISGAASLRSRSA
jgi:cytochrome d ubiquinol oxidase subunit I